MTIKEKTDEVAELELEPMRIKGHLVPEAWWDAETDQPLPFYRRHWLFIASVVVPALIAFVYLFFIAANQYSSEARFIVRENSGGGLNNLSSLMQGEKLSRATDETFAVVEYLQSRDAADALSKDDHLREILNSSDGDMFNRFPNFFTRPTNENLFQRYLQAISITIEPESGIGVLETRAFTPEDARSLATAMIKRGEILVNRLNQRAFQDALAFAEKTVGESQDRLGQVEAKLTDFRNTQKVIDPNKEAAAALTRLGTFTTGLADLQVQLAQLTGATPNSPMIAGLRERIKVLEDQIAKERADIAGNRSSLASTMADFDRLTLERELAERMLEAAMVHLTSARQEAEQQQLYLQTIVSPGLPDKAKYPRRLLILAGTIALSLCIYSVLNSIRKVAMEHEA